MVNDNFPMNEVLNAYKIKYANDQAANPNIGGIIGRELGTGLTKGGEYGIAKKQKLEEKDGSNLTAEEFQNIALSLRQMGIFLSAYCLGGGTDHKRTNQRSFMTTSKKLADGLSELILLCGNYSVIYERKIKGTKMCINNHQYIRKHNIFIVAERKKSGNFYLFKKHIKHQYYKGKIYCVSVPNKTIYVRRNGKAAWSGNCWRSGYSAHPNYFMNIATKDYLNTMADMQEQKYIPKVNNGWGASITVYVSHPHEGYPMFVPENIKDKVYLFDGLKNDKGALVQTGVSNELLIVGGYGKTIEEALKDAYWRCDRIDITNMDYRSDGLLDNFSSAPLKRYKAL